MLYLPKLKRVTVKLHILPPFLDRKTTHNKGLRARRLSLFRSIGHPARPSCRGVQGASSKASHIGAPASTISLSVAGRLLLSTRLPKSFMKPCNLHYISGKFFVVIKGIKGEACAHQVGQRSMRAEPWQRESRLRRKMDTRRSLQQASLLHIAFADHCLIR